MSTETTPQPPRAWGDPQPAASKWSGRNTAIAIAVAIVIAALGGVAIYAGTSANASGQQGFGGPGGGRGFYGAPPGGGQAFLRDALHGDFTVEDNGSYVTERMQTGEVTAVSATSITVRSKDSYTQTYAVDSSTRKAGDPATGSTVTVVAKVSGDTATATGITDGTLSQRGGFPGGGRQGGPPR
ncbi:hypothetical protein [Amycolatopsis pithecellobii]|uniref:DUF5666 domain-containing protein n=1 Tax=Amycolatopsis pithecellobii TaxID=664692 RepID=A0A6N7Z2Q4_9PSEU|nr:hypothetical protein [Amycolatopsis pithecellobii]MTD56003.1 hypothetical protein [Amycolatopsis pithecellobii]